MLELMSPKGVTSLVHADRKGSMHGALGEPRSLVDPKRIIDAFRETRLCILLTILFSRICPLLDGPILDHE